MPYVTETLIQNTGETDSDFVIRVNTFIADQAYYYETIGGGYPPAPFGSRSFKGFPPDKPSSDIVFYDSVAAQAKRIVTFSYENTYYYIYIGASPPIPGPPPSPTAGNIVIWGPSATLNDGVLQINTLAPNFINLSPATVAGEAVEYSQFTSALSGYVPTSRNITINGVTQDLSADRTWTVVGGVTSVGMSMPSEFSVTGSPVTGSGVLSASWLPVTGGYVLAGPAPGSPSATPSFRLLSALDIPDISATYLTLSSASSTYVAKSGSTMTGSLILNADPSSALGAATKQYVDNISAGINFHSPVNVATTANLSATYVNGSGGAGATLTATSNGALVIDGQSMSATQRVLVWQQSSGIENGIYNVTDAGSPTTPFILTRSADADNVPPGEIIYGDFVLTLSGTLYGGFGFICNTPGTITIGTTSISYIQYNVAQAVSAGYGLQELTPNVLSVDSSVIATVSSLGSYLTSATAAATYQPIGSYLTTISGLNISLLTNDSGYITSSALSGYLTSATAASTYYPLTNPSGYISGITSGDVTTALGFTPYDSANPAGYITTSALSGYLTSATAASTYYPLTNPSGYISGITSGDVTTALGFTPVNNAGDTMTGLLQFSGTGHAGVRLNNLTTAQRTALSATAGMTVFDTSLGALAQYTGTYWKYEQEKVATNTTTTVITAANITGLSHTLEANSIYKVEGYYSVVCNNTGGIKFTQTVPSGATVEVNYDGIAGTAATSIKIRSTASGTLTPNAINTANLSSGVMVSGVITTAATAGTVQFQFASGVATQTSTITPRSFVKLTKVG